jgi:lipopolysaccharide/colanic/teichoic acid biosynthesis glycosyltransferase
MVARNSSLKNTVVFPGTYVGEYLELTNAVLDRNCLVNTEFNSESFISEQFILGDMAEQNIKKWISSQLSRLTALFLTTLFLPLTAATALFLKLFRKGDIWQTIQAIRLPTATDVFSWTPVTLSFFTLLPQNASLGAGFWWKDFLLRFLPGLLNVIKGKMTITGVSPRTREDLEALDQDWREIYIRGKLGLITESLIHFGPHPTADERYSAEAIYIASPSVLRDIKLAIKYFSRLFLPGPPLT